jgi:peptidyl-prolyl cis-trans isomerase D
LYVTKAEGKFKQELETKKVDFDYVTLPYSNINDDQVKVSDDEIMVYLKKSPKKYKSEASASFDYVLFENKPSVEDEKSLELSINNVLLGTVKYNEETKQTDSLPGLRDVKNIREFVNANSDIKFDSTYLAKKDLPLDFQEQLFNLETGAIFGPYVFNGHQCVSKMVAKKPNASVKASHILLAYEGATQSSATRTKEEAQALANDLLAQAKANPSSFATLASANSDDPGSKAKGGQYDNISKGQMVPTFDAFIFDNPIGSIGVVETDFGFHVIKVDDKYSGVLLGTIAQKIEASEATIDQIYTQASKFEADANEKDFADVAKTNNLTVTPITSVKGSEEYVQGLGTQREIIRWALNDDNKVGSIRRFDVSQGYVIAKLKAKNDTGLMSIDAARDVITPILRNEKKAVLIRKKMSGSTLEEVAASSKSSIASAVGVSLASPVIQNLGTEPKVVGAAFGLKANSTSKLIDGVNGVYMVKTKNVVAAPAVTNYNSYIEQEKAQQSSSAQSRAYQALKEKADIKDNRARF